MKTKMIGVLSGVTIFALASCGNKETEVGQKDTSVLFTETLRLSESYKREMARANDTLCLDSLIQELGMKLDSLNFAIEADTDLALTEGENDTISVTLLTMREFYEKRKRELTQMPKDSIDDKRDQ